MAKASEATAAPLPVQTLEQLRSLAAQRDAQQQTQPPANNQPASDGKKAKKERTPDEQELLTMKRMAAMLAELPEPTRGRVVSWLTDKYRSHHPFLSGMSLAGAVGQ